MFGMHEAHKKQLRKNRVALLRSIVLTEELFGTLQEDNTLTEDMCASVKSLRYPTDKEKIGALLDLLPRRGPNAYNSLVRALVFTGQDQIADFLEPQAAASYKQENAERKRALGSLGGGSTSLPAGLIPPMPTQPPGPTTQSMDSDMTQIPEEIVQGSIMNMPVQPINSVDPWTQQAQLNFQINYRMEKATRGRALIINNEYFVTTKLGTRDGAQYDVVNLCELLKGLHFDTAVKDNVTAEGMLKLLEEERKHQLKSDCFILFIMSHGTHGRVYGVDGKTISIEDDIATKFDGKNCPELLNKPKLFFIQACQGKSLTSGMGGDTTDAMKESSIGTELDEIELQKKFKDLSMQDNEDSVPTFQRTVHEKADMLLAYSTLPGYKAWRHSSLGSWFVRTIVYVFSRYANQEHLMDLLLRVRQLMAEMRTMHTDEHFMQITRTSDTLMKKLYFCPGYTVSTV